MIVTEPYKVIVIAGSSPYYGHEAYVTDEKDDGLFGVVFYKPVPGIHPVTNLYFRASDLCMVLKELP